MERSIEAIWKEGFLRTDALVAPKVNDLYNQKSIDLVEKFRRMYRINIIALIAFTAVFLPVSFLVELPYMGMMLSVVFLGTAYFGKEFKRKLDLIDKNTDSYQYLKSFETWTKEMMAVNAKISRFSFSYIFLSMFVGFWFGAIGGDVQGQAIVNKMLESYPDMVLVFGFPLFGWIGLAAMVALLSVFGQRLGKFDLDIVYGRILKKLERQLAEMDELRA